MGLISILPVQARVIDESAGYSSGCPTSCGGGDKLWIDIACQQRSLVDPKVGCCKYYCSPEQTVRSEQSSQVLKNTLNVGVFESSIDLSTPKGIATLITTLLELFLGAIAVYAVVVAVRSGLALANPDSADAVEAAKKNLGAAIGGIFLATGGIIFLVFMSNFLGLGNITNILSNLESVINVGRN